MNVTTPSLAFSLFTQIVVFLKQHTTRFFHLQIVLMLSCKLYANNFNKLCNKIVFLKMRDDAWAEAVLSLQHCSH